MKEVPSYVIYSRNSAYKQLLDDKFAAAVAGNLKDIHLQQMYNTNSNAWQEASGAGSMALDAHFKPQRNQQKQCHDHRDCDNSRGEICAQTADMINALRETWQRFSCLQVANLALAISTPSSFANCKWAAVYLKQTAPCT